LHSFHQHCFDSYAANDKDCPVCWHKNKELLGADFTERRQSKVAVDADFTLKLSNARSNSFSVLADFFAKGIFRDEEKELAGQKKSIEKLRVPTEKAFDNSMQSKNNLKLVAK